MIIPNGKIIAIGGAERRLKNHTFKEVLTNELMHFLKNSILQRIVNEAGGDGARIEIITTASAFPKETGKEYLEFFTKIGCTNLGVMDIRSRNDINKNYLKRISECDCVMFSGGTQRRLATVFFKTPFIEIIKNRYQKHKLLVVGTSAGAMALGGIMIYKGTAMFTHLKGHVKTTPGLDLLHKVVFDSHFEKSGRFGRLAQVIALNPSCTGIGMGEDSGVIISRGNEMEVIGSGWVTIVDGSQIKYCNITDIDIDNPPSIENIKVHFSAKGDGYILSKRKFIKATNKSKKRIKAASISPQRT